MLKLRWLKGKAISPVGIRRIPIQRLRGRSARSSDDALGNLRGAKGLTYQGCQIWSTYEIYFTGTNRNFNPSSIAKWRDTKSRVMGDYQARFCERLRGETPLCLLDHRAGCRPLHKNKRLSTHKNDFLKLSPSPA